MQNCFKNTFVRNKSKGNESCLPVLELVDPNYRTHINICKTKKKTKISNTFSLTNFNIKEILARKITSKSFNK